MYSELFVHQIKDKPKEAYVKMKRKTERRKLFLDICVKILKKEWSIYVTVCVFGLHVCVCVNMRKEDEEEAKFVVCKGTLSDWNT